MTRYSILKSYLYVKLHVRRMCVARHFQSGLFDAVWLLMGVSDGELV